MLQLLWQLLLRVWYTFFAAKLSCWNKLCKEREFLGSNGAVDAWLFWLTIGPRWRHRPCVSIRGSASQTQKNNPSQESTSCQTNDCERSRCSHRDTGDSTRAALASAETARDSTAAGAQHTRANKAQKEHNTVPWRAAATTEAGRARSSWAS